MCECTCVCVFVYTWCPICLAYITSHHCVFMQEPAVFSKLQYLSVVMRQVCYIVMLAFYIALSPYIALFSKT